MVGKAIGIYKTSAARNKSPAVLWGTTGRTGGNKLALA